MPALTILVDGYNVLQGRHAEADRAALAHGARLFRFPRPVRQIVIVFDAAHGETPVRTGGCQGRVVVLFAAPDADSYLQERLRACPAPSSLLVVSDDRAIRDTARACGVPRMAAGRFWEAARVPPPRRPSASDPDRLSPDVAHRITDELRRRLGV